MNDFNQHIDHDLLMAYLSGNASPDQIEEVNSWLKVSEDNKSYLNQIEAVWLETGKLDPPPVAVNTDKAWNKLSNRIFEDRKMILPEPAPAKRRKLINYYISAAAVIVLLACSYLIIRFTDTKTDSVEYSSLDNILEKKLPDGSVVSLNKSSVVRFAENTDQKIRECTLEGEAFFDVKPDKEKPFIIHTQETSIKVLGTSFNVNSGQQEITVSVATGKVLFFSIDPHSKDTLSIILTPGEKGVYSTKSKTFNKKETPEDDLFWLNKTLIFRETQMSKVAEILNTTYKVEIILSDNIRNCIYSGTFKNESIEMVLEVLKESFDLTISKENETYNLYGEGC